MIIQLVRRAQKLIHTAANAKDLRNSYYYDRIYFKRMEKFFNILNNGKINRAIVNTAFTISPLGLQFGLPLATVLRQLGKEKYAFHNHNIQQNIKVLFYKRTYADLTFLVQLQFFDNHLFFVGLDVMRSLIETSEKTGIVNKVLDKYLDSPYTEGTDFPIICDVASNAIVINDDINFSICYVSGNTSHERQQLIVQGLGSVFT